MFSIFLSCTCGNGGQLDVVVHSGVARAQVPSELPERTASEAEPDGGATSTMPRAHERAHLDPGRHALCKLCLRYSRGSNIALHILVTGAKIFAGSLTGNVKVVESLLLRVGRRGLHYKDAVRTASAFTVHPTTFTNCVSLCC
jgi:hypothetical protein